jgi:hypothetical protein
MNGPFVIYPEHQQKDAPATIYSDHYREEGPALIHPDHHREDSRTAELSVDAKELKIDENSNKTAKILQEKLDAMNEEELSQVTGIVEKMLSLRKKSAASSTFAAKPPKI